MTCQQCGAHLGTAGGWRCPSTGQRVCWECFVKNNGRNPTENDQ